MGAHFKLNASHREAIEDQIESLIALLDTMDGDCDLEDGQDQEAVNEDGCDTLSRMLPQYALDQSSGPINAAIAARADLIADRGLIRNERGGWIGG